MHDIKSVRSDPVRFDADLARRGLSPSAALLLALDDARREAITRSEAWRQKRNALSRDVGSLKAAGDHDAANKLISEIAADEAGSTTAVTVSEAALTEALEELPNALDPAVPDGSDERSNVVVHQHGAPQEWSFTPRQHFDIGEALGFMDFAGAAKLSGSRFTVLRGLLARLERALGQWMISLQTEDHGYMEVAPPLLVNPEAVRGTGQLPKFKDDLFQTTDGRFLIPTAEVPLTNLVAGAILAKSELPIRVAALTPCFRAEAGSAGRDVRGMLRQHQFQKVEMVSITLPDESEAEHERMTTCAEAVLTALGLVWRRVLLCAGDTGFSAAKTYDLEVWLPGQGAWREISSCSNCHDFQARRMGARFRPDGQKGTAFVHTLNGSGVAVGRALIAVLETHQLADGSVLVPPVLRAWMGGMERISAGKAV
ncbi:serine--tRNA ligase [Humitalea sp. 24SJ18S-53]|uniref:serine--tRNA ligase n=1 Tax=Humitalea sp. 24SJ18S-53 TaxID=3422307 RepID=UPI003D666BBE